MTLWHFSGEGMGQDSARDGISGVERSAIAAMFDAAVFAYGVFALCAHIRADASSPGEEA
jgi:hypothetical protein